MKKIIQTVKRLFVWLKLAYVREYRDLSLTRIEALRLPPRPGRRQMLNQRCKRREVVKQFPAQNASRVACNDYQLP
jgi:hypothetical protein